MINTPFYILEDGSTPYYTDEIVMKALEKTDTGYAIFLNGLPNGELRFSMSESKNPVYAVDPLTIIAYGILFLLFLILLTGLTIGIVILVKHKKRQERNRENQ